MQAYIRDPQKVIGRMLRLMNMAEVSRKTGIPQSTLNRYKQRPGTLTLARGIEIAEAVGMTQEAWGKLIRGK